MQIKEDFNVANNYSVIEIQDEDRTLNEEYTGAQEIRMGVPYPTIQPDKRVVALVRGDMRLWVEEELLFKALIMLNDDQKSGREKT